MSFFLILFLACLLIVYTYLLTLVDRSCICLTWWARLLLLEVFCAFFRGVLLCRVLFLPSGSVVCKQTCLSLNLDAFYLFLLIYCTCWTSSIMFSRHSKSLSLHYFPFYEGSMHFFFTMIYNVSCRFLMNALYYGRKFSFYLYL